MRDFTVKEFPEQNAFILDDSTLIAAQCTRRAGKSAGIGRKQLRECFRFPGASNLYLGLTFTTVRNIYWKPIILQINKDLKLGGIPNESRLEMNFPNGSDIKLCGADADKHQMHKFLGGSYRSCVIDEAGSFLQDLRQLVYEMVLPAVSDWDGWVALTGTPTEITNGLFFDVTNGKEKGWSVHRWETEQNPFMRENWRKQVEMLIKNNPRIIETPAFRRMYKNEWVIDTDSLVYKYDAHRNSIRDIPHNDKMTHVLGVDLGFNDPTAFSILGYSSYDPTCYVKFGYKRSGMIISEVAERIKFLMRKYDPVAIVIDNASKQAVEELKQKYQIPLIAAEKAGKAEFIEIMNSDFITGNIKLLPGADGLAKEYANLIWDKDKHPKRIEHPSCENHISDSALYGYRYCYQYLSELRKKKTTEEEKIDQWFEDQSKKMDWDNDEEFWEK